MKFNNILDEVVLNDKWVTVVVLEFMDLVHTRQSGGCMTALMSNDNSLDIPGVSQCHTAAETVVVQ